MVDLTKVTDNW